MDKVCKDSSETFLDWELRIRNYTIRREFLLYKVLEQTTDVRKWSLLEDFIGDKFRDIQTNLNVDTRIINFISRKRFIHKMTILDSYESMSPQYLQTFSNVSNAHKGK